MPIRRSVDHTARLIRIKGTGEVTRKDYIDTMADVAAAGGSGYQVIAVFRAVNFDVRPEDLADWAQAVSDRVRTEVSTGRMALVMGSDAGRESAAYFIKRLRGRRPCETFDSVEAALAWLDLPPDTKVDPDEKF